MAFANGMHGTVLDRFNDILFIYQFTVSSGDLNHYVQLPICVTCATFAIFMPPITIGGYSTSFHAVPVATLTRGLWP